MRFAFFLTLATMLSLTFGCSNESANDKTSGGGKTSASHSHDDNHSHDGDHSHSHDDHGDGEQAACRIGPNGGHVYEFANESLLMEITQSKSGDVVRFLLLDADEKQAPMKVTSFKVTPSAGRDSSPFMLEPENPDEDGKTHSYMLEEKDLRIAIPLGVKVEVTTEDKTYVSTIEAHEHHDH